MQFECRIFHILIRREYWNRILLAPNSPHLSCAVKMPTHPIQVHTQGDPGVAVVTHVHATGTGHRGGCQCVGTDRLCVL